MELFKHRLQLAAAVFLLGTVLFLLWYALILLPEQKKEPEGTLVKNEPHRWMQEYGSEPDGRRAGRAVVRL